MKLLTLKLSKQNLLDLVLVVILASYYLFFFNKGLIFYDEGLYAHMAEMIMRGHIPYIDFFLQYQPGYFYLLAGLYKIFGPSIIVGRLLSLVICLGVFTASIYLLRAFKISSARAKIIVLLCIASFGYPLLNIPLLVWPTVLVTQLLMLMLIKIFKTVSKKNILLVGLLLASLFLIKQNIAAAYTVVVNILLLLGLQGSFVKKLKIIFLINSIWIAITTVWVYIFFLHNNIPALFEFLAFNLRLSSIYPFTYPPLSFLLQPLGLFKLLPYYLPIVFLLVLVIITWKKNKEKKLLVFFLPLAGFFTTIYPASDLLHVYPYFGLILVSVFIFISIYFTKFQKVSYLLLFLCIISGFYLTLFKEYYRYHPPYKAQNTPLHLPRAAGILIDKPNAENITAVYSFINTHTKKSDYIFAYPFSPMQYFIFERQNPSRYPIYYPGYLTIEEEKQTIKDIQQKKTAYIITDGGYINGTPLSKWIQKQKKIKEFGQFIIFKVQKNI